MTGVNVVGIVDVSMFLISWMSAVTMVTVIFTKHQRFVERSLYIENVQQIYIGIGLFTVNTN